MARVAYNAFLFVALVQLAFGAPTPTESPTVSPSQGPTVSPTTSPTVSPGPTVSPTTSPTVSPTISVVPVINTCPGVDQTWPELVVDGSFERHLVDWQTVGNNGDGFFTPNSDNNGGQFIHSGLLSVYGYCPACGVDYPPDVALVQNITVSSADLVCYASFWHKSHGNDPSPVPHLVVYVIDGEGTATELYNDVAPDNSVHARLQPVCLEWNSTDSYNTLMFAVSTSGGVWFLDDVSIKCDTGIPPPPAPIRTPAPTPAPTVDSLALGLGLGFGLPLALVLLIMIYCRYGSQSAAVSYSVVSK